LQLMSLTDVASLEHVLVTTAAEFIVETVGKRGAAHQEKLRICDIDGKRGKKGKVLDISGRLKTLSSASA
jgi:DNA topoisomerase 4 subunit A